jgi:hypothetical protein
MTRSTTLPNPTHLQPRQKLIKRQLPRQALIPLPTRFLRPAQKLTLRHLLIAYTGIKPSVRLFVGFQDGILRNLILIPNRRPNLATLPVRVAVYALTILCVGASAGDEKVPAVLALLDENIVFNHLDKLKANQVTNRINLI